jgi:hypothetical protein
MTKGNPVCCAQSRADPTSELADSATAAREIELSRPPSLSRRLREVAIYGKGNCRLPLPVWNFEGYL